MFQLIILLIICLLYMNNINGYMEIDLNELKKSLERIEIRKLNPEKFIIELENSEFSEIINITFNTKDKISSKVLSNKLNNIVSDTLPLVFLHGMGDSCFNNGMKSLTKESGRYLNVYSDCIPTGDTRIQDTMNGFFMNMNENVDIFANKVRNDINLKNGFNCVGLSQGNNICRGYIQKYNNPIVNTHLSIHGPIVGVASLPHCYPENKIYGSLCNDINNILSKLAYTPKIQNLLFQANYFRNIEYLNDINYKLYSQIANWNNEGNIYNETITTNFLKTNKFAMIKANSDTVVVPREGEWFGSYDIDYNNILTMTQTNWYINNLFGLKTVNENNKIYFNSTTGNHLEFSDEELYGWLDLYCL